MGLFSSGGGTSRIRRLRGDVTAANKKSFQLIDALQNMILQSIREGGVDTRGFPRQVPPDNPLLQAVDQRGLDVALGTGGLGSALEGAAIDSLTRTGADLIDPATFDQFFEQSIARPGFQDFNKALSQASNFVAGIGGARSGGFGTILGDLTDEFSQDLLGERARLQTQLALQAVNSEDQRLNRLPEAVSGALAPLSFASGLGASQFNREGLRGAEELNNFLLSQPYNNPYITQFLQAAFAGFDPGLQAALS